jgi:quinoprotein dehydrogenase-associated probable ABC transporter substrate-binding protein
VSAPRRPSGPPPAKKARSHPRKLQTREAPMSRWPRIIICLMLLGAAALHSMAAAAQSERPPGESTAAARDDLSIELVDPKVLRVCADPRNLPFSNQNGEGFENKLAEFLGAKFNKQVAYTWYPQAPGFVRNTLAALKCDVIIGYPQGSDVVQTTNPYYRTTYALVFKPGRGLDDIKTLADPRLKEKRLGVVAGTPPSTYMATSGLMARAKPYPLVVDTRFDNSIELMIKDLVAGDIDVGVLWGPLAGYYAKQSKEPLVVVPLTHEESGPPMVFRIAMGVRPSDQQWKRQLNQTIQQNQAAINHILLGFGVPLLDESNMPITEESAAKRP